MQGGCANGVASIACGQPWTGLALECVLWRGKLLWVDWYEKEIVVSTVGLATDDRKQQRDNNKGFWGGIYTIVEMRLCTGSRILAC